MTFPKIPLETPLGASSFWIKWYGYKISIGNSTNTGPATQNRESKLEDYKQMSQTGEL